MDERVSAQTGARCAKIARDFLLSLANDAKALALRDSLGRAAELFWRLTRPALE
jgi:hypothetical protein